LILKIPEGGAKKWWCFIITYLLVKAHEKWITCSITNLTGRETKSGCEIRGGKAAHMIESPLLLPHLLAHEQLWKKMHMS
jgi:hypothetical protein